MSKKTNSKKAKLLRELAENPLVSRACTKVGISRSTYYRWVDDDDNFSKLAEYSRGLGREKINDFAESKLLENISANLHQAIAFWLSNNSKQYKKPTTLLHFRENERLAKLLRDQNVIVDNLANMIGYDKITQDVINIGENSLNTLKEKLEEKKLYEERKFKPKKP